MTRQLVHIVTDSTCDLDQPVLQELGVHMVPLNVLFGPETYKDRSELPPGGFYAKLRSGAPHPTTSQPSPAEFRAVYERLLLEGGEIVSLQLSSKMSGTWQSATLARKELGSDRIHVIDALTTSIGLGNLVTVCARAAREGRSTSDIVSLASYMIATHRLLFVVDTLEYLRKGGRIGLAAAFIGGLLNIKPILSLRDGQVCLLERCRGSKNVQNRFIELVDEYVVQHSGKKLCTAVTYAGDSDNLDAMLRAMSGHLDTSQALRTEIGAVVGAHVGPGCYGISLHCLPD